MKTIAVASGKGGVGKTSFAANLGLALVELGNRVVLFDADLALANMDVILGTQPEFTLQHVLSGEKTIFEAITPGPRGIGSISGGSAIYGLMHSGPKRLNLFLTQVQALAKTTEYLIFDASAGLDNKVMTFLRAAGETLLLCTPEPAAIADAYATAKVLFRRKPEAKITLIVNMVSSEKEALAVYAKLSEVCTAFIGREIGFGGFVRYDERAMKSVRERVPYVVAHPQTPASQDVATIAKSLQARKGTSDDLAGLTAFTEETPRVAKAS